MSEFIRRAQIRYAQIRYAQQELERAGFFDSDSDYNGELGKAVMELIKVFSKQGHSGSSARRASAIFEKLVSFEPLTPLTGEDSEWIEVGTNRWQNKRYSTVFKDENGAYDIDSIIFREPSGACYTNNNSRVPVEFPYTPTRRYVDIDL